MLDYWTDLLIKSLNLVNAVSLGVHRNIEQVGMQGVLKAMIDRHWHRSRLDTS